MVYFLHGMSISYFKGGRSERSLNGCLFMLMRYNQGGSWQRDAYRDQWPHQLAILEFQKIVLISQKLHFSFSFQQLSSLAFDLASKFAFSSQILGSYFCTLLSSDLVRTGAMNSPLRVAILFSTSILYALLDYSYFCLAISSNWSTLADSFDASFNICFVVFLASSKAATLALKLSILIIAISNSLPKLLAWLWSYVSCPYNLLTFPSKKLFSYCNCVSKFAFPCWCK